MSVATVLASCAFPRSPRTPRQLSAHRVAGEFPEDVFETGVLGPKIRDVDTMGPEAPDDRGHQIVPDAADGGLRVPARHGFCAGNPCGTGRGLRGRPRAGARPLPAGTG